MANEDNQVTPSNEGEQVVLSGGRIALVKRAKGRDLERGAAVAENAANPMSLMMGVAAQVTKIGGAGITYEDLLEMPMLDILELIGAITGETGKGNVRALSQLSAISS